MKNFKTVAMCIVVLVLFFAICNSIVDALTITYNGTKTDRVLKIK